MEANLNLVGDNIIGEIEFTGKDLDFDLNDSGENNNKFEKIIQDVIESTDEIRFSAEIKGEKDDLSFSISSNLDDLLMKQLKASLGEELDQAKQKIYKKVDEQVNKKRAELEKFISDKDGYLMSEIGKYEQVVNDKMKLVDDKIDEVKKSKLGGAKDKLKGLFD